MRYQVMARFLYPVVKTVDVNELSAHEKRLLCVAYKNFIGAKRASWKILSSLHRKEIRMGNQDRVERISKYRDNIGYEIWKICSSLWKLLKLRDYDSAILTSTFYPKTIHTYTARMLQNASRINWTMACAFSDFLVFVMCRFVFPDEFVATKLDIAKMVVESSRKQNVYTAKLAGRAGRHEEILKFIKTAAESVDVEELTLVELNLLLVAYETVTEARCVGILECCIVC
ncbi:hypothetical protein IFM89_038357 [Coptis chinensis]|uniref:14-3-3 domain-containing protein n=1 Tax=Coptis chinensis TaxID=261450 RepID=A0A835I881_9MAGN|nr:hypothetical protein IFM89_038357 [Coptis chinensis]